MTKPTTNPYRADFPVLSRKVHGEKTVVYLDNAATSQKPARVIDAVSRYYRETNANVHRGMHALAEEATAAYEDTRRHLARFLGAPDPAGVIFTRGTTESINLVARAWAEEQLSPGD
ncbi:MAG: aminotransferase class V-fold PLP-dependent enzyme, partial [Verrucomicrobia bacterium]|nr:aminotransferase class V-fold PLP-dependent enzyme [Verrucomicrobiota bacterium]